MQIVVKLATWFTAILIVAVGTAFGHLADRPFADGVVAGDGSIRLPENFRTGYVMLGAWPVAGDADTGTEVGLHVVYAPKNAVDAFRRTGRFPDGAVLVKGLFDGSSEILTTGKATSAASTAGYFVMVKDAQGRFPGNGLWGDGWGWAFFSADDTVNTVTSDYRAECLASHEPARSTDLIYDQAYPVLRP